MAEIRRLSATNAGCRTGSLARALIGGAVGVLLGLGGTALAQETAAPGRPLDASAGVGVSKVQRAVWPVRRAAAG
ncbi:MAG: hypothetical protein K2Q20_00890, partial [Phycisphaerales bacterium]|nr:hypothetical protein [Phycisphaerales bacterium]